ncbi:MAG: cytochrome c oxidase subunit II [Thermoanaerobaculia bacterium]
MWKNFPLFPDKATELAGEVDQLTFVFLAIALFFSLLVATLVFYFAIRYRRRSADEIGETEETGIWLEIVWSVIPLVILLGMFFWGAKIYIKAYRPPSDAVEYFVTGKQWMWKFQHPEGNREINHLHVPRGQRIRLNMTSEDVIHSFFVPAFRVKADVLPGRYTSIWFEATKTGTFTLFCAEFCGAEHSQMMGSVIVMEPQDYEQWLAAGQPEKTVIGSGEELFGKYVCNTCHFPDSAARAPILHGIWGEEVALGNGESVVVDANYVRESILEPAAKMVKGYQPLMPTYQGQLSEEELVQLISYVRSLSDVAAEGEGSAVAVDSNEGEQK